MDWFMLLLYMHSSLTYHILKLVFTLAVISELLKKKRCWLIKPIARTGQTDQ